jgi:hypothetical protein
LLPNKSSLIFESKTQSSKNRGQIKIGHFIHIHGK